MSRMTTPTLARFPSEILLIIASYLHVPGLNALLQTCQRFHWLFDALLYQLGRKCISVPGAGTPLIWAVQKQRTSVLKRLLKGDEWPSDKCNGTTALHEAVLCDNLEALKILLDAGADPRVKDAGKESALAEAAGNKKEDAVRLLLNRHMDLQPWTEFESWWERALTRAVVDSNESICRLLLEETESAHRSTTNSNRSEIVNGILHFVAGWYGDCGIIRLLCAYGADPSRSSAGSRTLLHPTAHNGHVDAVKLALEYGVDPTVRNNDGLTALHLAAGDGHVDVIGVLIDAGVPVDIPGERGLTPLLFAALGRQDAAARRLLDAGADACARNESGFNALDLTIPMSPPPALIDLLLKAGTDASPPPEEIRMTPLHWAARTGQFQIIRLLCDAGVEVDRADQRGRTALHLAVREGHTDSVEVLLQAGADAFALDERGRTPLVVATKAENKTMVDLLLRPPWVYEAGGSKEIDAEVEDSKNE
ncbi:ankyrin repeat-containing domain protein [Aspergillus keveii]|uniref:Ankyrin repeat-containing domain protein n=1 Tax=Aspergillus keveii TaxID=714993 RepID=A0ABR4FQ75_9EURO